MSVIDENVPGRCAMRDDGSCSGLVDRMKDHFVPPRPEPTVAKGRGYPQSRCAPGMESRPLTLLSIVMPAFNEEGCILSTVQHLHLELKLHEVPHEIVVVDDGSTDGTGELLRNLQLSMDCLVVVTNEGPHGFGRAVIYGLDHSKGDAVVIMMADESDDCRETVRYWDELNKGWDCVFGSRFVKSGGLIDYPPLKLLINRMANLFLRIVFAIRLNDTTNAFKAYRREVIDGCRPFISPHFNLTVELPLKAIVRGFSWKVIPTTWRNRRTGKAKLLLREMGSRYLFICMYVWLEKYFSRGDYMKTHSEVRKEELVRGSACTIEPRFSSAPTRSEC